MRHNQNVKNRVQELRMQGASLGKIHTQTKVPKTTIRTWIKDIKLSTQQINALKENVQDALQKGRIRKQSLQKELRLKNENELMKKGINEVNKLTKQELLISGVALYWAEGFKNKHEHRLGFCNSDPDMIRFYIRWLKEIFKVKNEDIVARLTLNESYKDKSKQIENYWIEITGLPKEKFTKTFYQKTKWKKQYNNDNYHGVLRIHVKKSLNSLFLMRGWIEGLKSNVVK